MNWKISILYLMLIWGVANVLMVLGKGEVLTPLAFDLLAFWTGLFIILPFLERRHPIGTGLGILALSVLLRSALTIVNGGFAVGTLQVEIFQNVVALVGLTIGMVLRQVPNLRTERYPIFADGFEGRDLALTPSGLRSIDRLVIDNQPAAKGQGKHEFLLRRNDGTEVVAKVQPAFLDPFPQLTIDGRAIQVVEPLKWYQWLFVGLPIVMVINGGFIEAAVGLTALATNARLFRSYTSRLSAYAVTVMISVCAVVVVLILVGLFEAVTGL